MYTNLYWDGLIGATNIKWITASYLKLLWKQLCLFIVHKCEWMLAQPAKYRIFLATSTFFFFSEILKKRREEKKRWIGGDTSF